MTINILKLLLILYASSCLLLYFFQNYLFFFPRSTPTANRDRLKDAAITIKSGGLKLRGWLNAKENPQAPLIIYYGGNAEEVSHTVLASDQLKKASVLAINYRGYGDSEGKPSIPLLVQDAIEIFNQMVDKKGIAPNNIILMGRSLGSGIAVQVAGRRQVMAVILITPFDSLEHIAKHHYPIFPVRLLLRHKLDSLALAAKIDRPVLVLMAENDQIAPDRYSRNLIKNWLGLVTEFTIPATDHNNISDTQEYWRRIDDFIGKQIRQRSM